MVRRAVPVPGLPVDCHPPEAAGQLTGEPDVIETAALVGRRPIGRAIAPPRIDLLRLRTQVAHRVDPSGLLTQGLESLGFDRGVADDVEQLLVAPDVVLERSHIEIADEDRGRVPRLAASTPS